MSIIYELKSAFGVTLDTNENLDLLLADRKPSNGSKVFAIRKSSGVKKCIKTIKDITNLKNEKA